MENWNNFSKDSPGDLHNLKRRSTLQSVYPMKNTTPELCKSLFLCEMQPVDYAVNCRKMLFEVLPPQPNLSHSKVRECNSNPNK